MICLIIINESDKQCPWYLSYQPSPVVVAVASPSRDNSASQVTRRNGIALQPSLAASQIIISFFLRESPFLARGLFLQTCQVFLPIWGFLKEVFYVKKVQFSVGFFSLYFLVK